MSVTISFNPFINTSGSTDFNLTTNEIIEVALRYVGGLADGQIPTNEQFANSKKLLNMMVKNWRGEGIFLWDTDWITVPLIASTIVLGTDGLDQECTRNHLSNDDNRPITGAQQASFWKPLTTTTGADWAAGQEYTSIANPKISSSFPNIDEGRIRIIADQTTNPLTKLTQEEYFFESNPQAIGQPNKFYFQRLEIPQIFLSPFPDSSTDYIFEFLVDKFQDDFDTGANNPDFLQEWIEPLSMNLAVRLAPQNGIFGGQLRDLQALAFQSKERARMLDRESGEIFVQPSFKRRK